MLPLERSERERRFGLDPTGGEDLRPVKPIDRIAKQRGLADSRLAANDQGATSGRPRLVHQCGNPLPFSFPAVQHGTSVGRNGDWIRRTRRIHRRERPHRAATLMAVAHRKQLKDSVRTGPEPNLNSFGIGPTHAYIDRGGHHDQHLRHRSTRRAAS